MASSSLTLFSLCLLTREVSGLQASRLSDSVTEQDNTSCVSWVLLSVPSSHIHLPPSPTLHTHTLNTQHIKYEALGWAFGISFSPVFSSVLIQPVDTQALLSPLGEHGAKECADLTIDTRCLPSTK